MISRPQPWVKGYHAISHSVDILNSTFSQEQRETFLKNVQNTIDDKDELTPVADKTSPLQFYSHLVRHVFDLDDTFQTLAEIDELHKRRISLPDSVPLQRFRKLLHEFQLEEIYIFSNRCDILITFLIREFQKDSEFEDWIGVADVGVRSV